MDLAVATRVRSAQQRYVIDDSSKIGEARRAAQTLASFEFTAEVAGKVTIAASELANNLLLHAGRGELLIQTLGDTQRAFDVVQTQFRVGSTDLRYVTQRQLALNSTQAALLRAQTEQRVQRVNLHLALGGSFETRPQPPPQSQPQPR